MASTASKVTVLITGASSGIVAIYADRLARRGLFSPGPHSCSLAPGAALLKQ